MRAFKSTPKMLSWIEKYFTQKDISKWDTIDIPEETVLVQDEATTEVVEYPDQLAIDFAKALSDRKVTLEWSESSYACNTLLCKELNMEFNIPIGTGTINTTDNLFSHDGAKLVYKTYWSVRNKLEQAKREASKEKLANALAAINNK